MLPMLSIIPDPIKQQIVDSIVNFLVQQAQKLLGEQVAKTIRGFSSQASFRISVEQAIKNGAKRFVMEYTEQDEDLVAAISNDSNFLKKESVQKGLLALIKRPGAWLPDEQETLIQQFSDILPERINRERVNKAVVFFLHCVVEELWTLPGAKEIREVYGLQFQKISAEAAQEQVALARKQLETATQLSAEIRQALLQLTSALEKNLLVAPVIPSHPHPKPYHNLPRPDYVSFVGRKNELKWLRERLSPSDRAWLIAITGIGGVGKSALALDIAHEFCAKYDELPPDERFDAIVWISAKIEVLTIQGHEPAVLPEALLRNLEDVYTAIARVLNREEITRASIEDQGYVVEKVLKEQKTLLVIDNLESVQDERVRLFLRNLPAPTKALITSRELLDIADAWQLKGLSETEADLLIIEETNLRQVSLGSVQRRRIYDLTSGLPLPIKLAVARVSGGESFRAVERWLGDATGDLPEYCIAGQAELAKLRDPNAWILLLACSLFDRDAGASRDALGYVADLSEADLDRGLVQLLRLFLINQIESDRFWVLPIVQRYSAIQLTIENSNQEITRLWLNWIANHAKYYRADPDLEIVPKEEFSIEYPNILMATRWCHKNMEWKLLLDLVIDTLGYAFLSSLISDLEQLLQWGQDALNIVDDIQARGEIEIYLARVFWMRRESDSHRIHLLSAASIFENLNIEDDPKIWAKLLHIYLYLDRHLEAKKLVQKILSHAERTNDDNWLYLGAYRLAQIYMWGEMYDLALLWLEKAEKYAIVQNSQRNLSAVLSRRGEIFINQNKYDEAEKLLVHALQLDSKLNDLRHIGYDKQLLAKIYYQTGRSLMAEEYERDAINIFDRLKIIQPIKPVHNTIGSTETSQ
jgi:tetratricopeptide (TPR) repeat protein